MLGQAQITKYLDRCDTKVGIEEVLSAYIASKYMKGATSERVLIKLKYLAIYLRVNGHQRVLDLGAEPWRVLTMEVAIGGGRIGLLRSVTEPGRAAWNHIRRATPSTPGAGITTDGVYGGPGPVSSYLQPVQAQPFILESRAPWLERYFVLRTHQSAGAVPEEDVPAYSTNPEERTSTLPPYERDETAASTGSVPAVVV
ncbi:hypothetical protein C8R46DRAFT_1061823 [Mycena filopes]|nr:hypothetical protein C8R46DRAFT_1061823 [Mycena filopes]